MNAQVSGLLEQMKTQLVEEQGEEAWGPNSELSTDHDDDGEPGESGAENESDVMDTFDLFLSSILDALLDQYDTSEEDAVSFIFSVADELAAEGKLPEIPSEDADDAADAEWVGLAKTAGFEGLVLTAAEESAEEDEEGEGE